MRVWHNLLLPATKTRLAIRAVKVLQKHTQAQACKVHAWSATLSQPIPTDSSTGAHIFPLQVNCLACRRQFLGVKPADQTLKQTLQEHELNHAQYELLETGGLAPPKALQNTRTYMLLWSKAAIAEYALWTKLIWFHCRLLLDPAWLG